VNHEGDLALSDRACYFRPYVKVIAKGPKASPDLKVGSWVIARTARGSWFAADDQKDLWFGFHRSADLLAEVSD